MLCNCIRSQCMTSFLNPFLLSEQLIGITYFFQYLFVATGSCFLKHSGRCVFLAHLRLQDVSASSHSESTQLNVYLWGTFPIVLQIHHIFKQWPPFISNSNLSYMKATFIAAITADVSTARIRHFIPWSHLLAKSCDTSMLTSHHPECNDVEIIYLYNTLSTKWGATSHL